MESLEAYLSMPVAELSQYPDLNPKQFAVLHVTRLESYLRAGSIITAANEYLKRTGAHGEILFGTGTQLHRLCKYEWLESRVEGERNLLYRRTVLGNNVYHANCAKLIYRIHDLPK